jgi:hypothetical protein
MRTSLTARLVHAAEDLRLLRADVNTLAMCLLDDDNGISEQAYMTLAAVCERLGGMPQLNVDVTDGRYYIPNRSM